MRIDSGWALWFLAISFFPHGVPPFVHSLEHQGWCLAQAQSSVHYFSEVVAAERMEDGKTMKPWTKIRCYLQLHCIRETSIADTEHCKRSQAVTLWCSPQKKTWAPGSVSPCPPIHHVFPVTHIFTPFCTLKAHPHLYPPPDTHIHTPCHNHSILLHLQIQPHTGAHSDTQTHILTRTHTHLLRSVLQRAGCWPWAAKQGRRP